MTGKTYSAGTIFLQVVPVFGDTMNEITRQSKDMNRVLGNEMEKGGRDAGKRAGEALGTELEKGAKEGGKKAGDAYQGEFEKTFRDGITKMQREIKPIKINVERNELRKEFAEIKREMNDLGKAKIGVDLDAKAAHARVEALLARLKTLRDQTVKLNVKTNLDEATRGVEAFLQRVERAHPEVKVKADFKQAERAMSAYESKMRKAAKSAADAFGSGAISQQAREIKAELDALSEVDFDLDMSTEEFDRKFLQVESKLAGLIAENPAVNIDVRNAKVALGTIETVQAAANHLDQTYHMGIEVDGAAKATGIITMLGALMRGAGGDGNAAAGGADNAANSFRAFSFIVLGLVSILPALIPLIGALGGALLALGPILAGVGAGLGVAILGFSGIGNAVQALGAQAKAGTKNTEQAAKQAEAASRRIADAAQGVADAKRSLARAEEDAARRSADANRALVRAREDAVRRLADAEKALTRAKQDAADRNKEAAQNVVDAEQRAAEDIKAALARRADAEKRLANAQRDATRAQQNLAKARLDAKKELADNADALSANKLDERQGVIDVFNATVADTAARQDGGATNLEKEQAAINLANAQLRLKNIREERTALEEKDAAGIDGTDAVQTAQDQLTTALENQKEATENLGQAAADVDKARVDGAAAVTKALQDQKRAAQDGAQAISDAALALKQTVQDNATAISDAQRNVARTAADNARSIADAHLGLTRAQEDYQRALKGTDEVANTTALNVADAMSKLSPAGQEFARFLFGLREGFYNIRDAAQEGMLPGVQDAFETIIAKYSNSFPKFVSTMAKTLGGMFREFGKMMTNPLWSEFFGMVNDLAPRFTRQFGKAMGNWLSVFVRLLTIAAPWAVKLSDALLAISEAALDFVKSKKGTKVITDFLEYAQKVGPDVWAFFKDIVRAAINLGEAMAPLGGLILKGLDAFLDWIAKMDPKVLSAIVTGIIMLVIAFQALNGIVALVKGIQAGLALAGGGWILIILLVVGALIYLYTQSETARKIIDAVMHAIGDVITWLWENVTKPTLEAWGALFKATWEGMVWLWENVLKPSWDAIAEAAVWLWETVLKPTWDALGAAWDGLLRGLVWVWDNVLHPVITAIGDVFSGLWNDFLSPIFGWIGDTWDTLFHAMETAWNAVLWPIIDTIGRLVMLMWTAYIQVALLAIGTAWNVMRDIINAAWTDYISPIIGWIGDVVTALWEDYISPALENIGEGWTIFQGVIETVWGVIEPIFTAIGTAVGTTLTGIFETAVTTIGNLWGGLQSLLQAPIKAVIEFTNRYLIGGFNRIADFVGSAKMSEIPMPDSLQNKPKQKVDIPANPGGKNAQTKNALATGGVLSGYTPGRDVHRFVSPTGGQLDLSGGEAVMRPEWTAAIGEDTVNRWNRLAREGGVNALRAEFGRGNGRGRRAFAKGGVFWPVPGHETGTYPGHDGVDINRGSGWDDYGDPIRAYRSGTIVYVGAGKGYGNAIFEAVDGGPTVVYGHTSAQAVHAGQRVVGGQLIGRVGNTGHSTAPHLHFGVPGGTTAGALALLNGAVTAPGGADGGDGGGFHLPGWLSKIMGGPLAWAKGLADKAGDALVDRFGDNPLIKTLGGVAHKLVDGLVDKVKGLVGAATNVIGEAGSVATGSVQKIVQTMAAARGWGDGAEWNALSTIIQRESGWDPNAKNPGSSAAGLFQKMTSLHGPLESTVGGQTTWGLNYIKDRYGDPIKALNFWNANGSYADGGIIGSTHAASGELGGETGGVANNGTMMYDNGGYLPPGLTSVVNLTGKPEPVFTADQFKNLGRGGDAQAAGWHYEPHFEGSNLTAADVAEDLNFAMRANARKGKYAGRNV